MNIEEELDNEVTIDDLEGFTNEENLDEKEEEEVVTRRVVKPKRKVVQTQPKLDPPRLTGPRGIGILESVFSDVKLKGSGHEEKDLLLIMGRLKHWAHRLFPRMTFDDCIAKIEELGSKKAVSVYVTKLRLGMEEVPRGYETSTQSEIVEVPRSVHKRVLTVGTRNRMLQNKLFAELDRLEILSKRTAKLESKIE